jgi:glutathione synthase/RimK-type ligase-like ATP-grasp enzyme
MKIALVKDINRFWTIYGPELEKRGAKVVYLDVFKSAELSRLLEEDWDGFIWRAKHDPFIRTLAKRLIYLFDAELGIKTFPSWNSYWHYDDKVAQAFLLKKHGINTPKNYVFYDKEEALDFAARCEYPIVFKSAHGSGSANVWLVKNKSQAVKLIKRAFGKGIKTFFKEDLLRKYVYFQEFLKDNAYDYRAVCYADERIASFKRIANKDGFASGSGVYDFDEPPKDLLEFVKSAHEKLGNPLTMAYDVMKDNSGNWAVTEISSVFADLNSWSGDSPTPTYAIEKDGSFRKIERKENDHLYFVDLLARKWGLSAE